MIILLFCFDTGGVTHGRHCGASSSGNDSEQHCTFVRVHLHVMRRSTDVMRCVISYRVLLYMLQCALGDSATPDHLLKLQCIMDSGAVEALAAALQVMSVAVLSTSSSTESVGLQL